MEWVIVVLEIVMIILYVSWVGWSCFVYVDTVCELGGMELFCWPHPGVDQAAHPFCIIGFISQTCSTLHLACPSYSTQYHNHRDASEKFLLPTLILVPIRVVDSD
jgi:hypothetical protein